MDINNNQQTNTFSKGMNTDTSDMYIQNDQYRYAENLRFLTNEGENSGELRSIENWEKVIFEDKDLNIYEFHKILKTTQIRQYGIIIAEDDSDTWSIFVTDFGHENDEEHFDIWRVFGPCSEKLGDKLSVVTRWESDENVKLYIADGIHQLMSLNIKGGHLQKDIDYILNKDETPLILLEILHSLDEGLLRPAVIQYAYVLYNYGGSLSSVSHMSEAISLYNKNNDGGFMYNEISGKSLELKGVIYSQKYENIKIYRITYEQNGQLPRINVIYDSKFNNGEFIFVDRGVDLYEITVSEFISQEKVYFKPLLIESKNDYLFCANVQYENIDVDEQFANIKDEDISVEITPHWHTLRSDTNAVLDGNERSLKRGERYRYGVVFYDKYNRKSSVRWIEDVDVPEWSSDDVVCETRITSYRPSPDAPYTNNDVIKVKVYGIKVTIKNLPEECSGFEVVRCKRTVEDSKTLFLGIIGRSISTWKRVDDETISPLDLTYSCPIFTMEPILHEPEVDWGELKILDADYCAASSKKILMFACPEFCYQPDDVRSILDTWRDNIYIKFIQDYVINNTEEQLESGHSDGSGRYIVDKSRKFRRVGSGRPVITDTFEKNDRLTFLGSDAAYVRYYSSGLRDYNRLSKTTGGVLFDYGSDLLISDSNIEYINEKADVINNQVMFPYGTTDYCTGNVNISSIGYASSPKFDSFSSEDNITIANDQISVGQKTYINWDAKSLLYSGQYSDTTTIGKDAKDKYSKNKYIQSHYPVTTGSNCILLGTSSDLLYTTKRHLIEYPYPISVADLRKSVWVPYGGDSEFAKLNSVYYSFGNYKEHESNVDTIEVFDGDCYINIFEFNSGHAWYSDKYSSAMIPTIYRVPIETSINLQASCGSLYSKSTSPRKYYILDQGPVTINEYSQEKPAYLYNTAYNVTPDIITHSPVKYTEVSTDKYDIRVLYSKSKTNGESTDSWTLFLAANFIDVDTRFGQLTELRLFKDTLMFWQDNATGVLSVNERTILQDVNDTNIILGNGDVLQRYDYLTTEYGMKPGQFADTQSNTTLYWWDGYKKEILGYSGGQAVMPMNKIKTVSNYINQHDEVTDPELTYDYKYNEVLMNVVEGGTLVYNELMLQFSSIYTKQFDHSIRLNDTLLLAHNDNMYEWNRKWMSNEQNTHLPSKLKYIVNNNPLFVKTYDITTFGLGEQYHKEGDNRLKDLVFEFDTKDQHSELKDWSIEKGVKKYKERGRITNREYDYRFDIPRYGNEDWGNRMKGKVMRCELTVDNSADFSIQYITTKYRISFS